jgi:ATP-dependent RNA helicase RhlE
VAARYTTDAVTHEHAAPAERRGDVEHRFVGVAHEEKVDALVRELRREGRGRTLVFVRTKRGADRLVKRLRAHDLEAAAMHGDKSQAQREKALRRFHAGETDTLVATDVAARGIDVEDVTHVINFDAPAAREDYVHRVGRTGRAGRTGIGITFVLADQADDVHKIARELDLHREFAVTGFTAEAASRPVRTHAGAGTRSGARGGRRRRR